MRNLFTAEGERALAAVLQRQPLFAFDFDGTLAPIVEHPGDARVPAAVALQLARLAQLRPVAIVTGRSIGDVAPRLGFVPTEIVGNHGAEDAHRSDSARAAQAFDGLRARLRDAQPELQRAGVAIEDKGQSLALHYRLAPDRAAALQRIEALLDPLGPRLKSFGGKCVVNVVAADAADKGDAVIALVRRHGAGSAVFLGDDLNDEAVFERAPPHWLTVRVGCDSAVASRAQFCLDAHATVASLLERVLTLLAPH